MSEKIQLEKIRLNKFISLCGICSRRDADRYIDQGRVCVNGKVVTQPAPLVDGNEIITVDGQPIQVIDEVKVWVFYKPAGLVTTHNDEQGRETVFDFVKEQGLEERVISVGRLDLNSEGLLLLTTDGKVSEIIRSKKVDKEYYVQVDGIINQEAIDKLQLGVEIGFNGTKYITKPCKASLIDEIPAFGARGKKIRDERHGPTSWASITVNEGKFRQVRKMTAAVGFPTLRLVRIRIGNVRLNDLQAGEVKKVMNFEL